MCRDNEVFPFMGSVAERFRHLLRYAILAPSTHNTQPWQFEITDDAVLVYEDPNRFLHHIDPEGRERLLSIGGLLEHLRLAMLCHLMQPEIELFPEAASPHLVARVGYAGEANPTREELRSFTYVGRRHTVRGDLDDCMVDDDDLQSLLNAVNDRSAGIVLIESPEAKGRVAEMVHLGDELLMAEDRYRREVGAWIHHGQKSDGIPARALGVDQIRATLAPWAVGRIDTGTHKANVDSRNIRRAPALAMLCTAEDNRSDWVRGGMALARVTLAAAARGIAASYYVQPIQFPAFRQEVKRMANALGFPQIILRLGYADEAEPTPRRPIEDVLIERTAPRSLPPSPNAGSPFRGLS